MMKIRGQIAEIREFRQGREESEGGTSHLVGEFNQSQDPQIAAE